MITNLNNKTFKEIFQMGFTEIAIRYSNKRFDTFTVKNFEEGGDMNTYLNKTVKYLEKGFDAKIWFR